MKNKPVIIFHLFFKDIAIIILSSLIFSLIFKQGIDGGDFKMSFISFLFIIPIYLAVYKLGKKYKKYYKKDDEIVITKREMISNYSLLLISLVIVLISLFNLNIFPILLLILWMLFWRRCRYLWKDIKNLGKKRRQVN